MLGPPEDDEQEAEDNTDLQAQAQNLGVDMDLLETPGDAPDEPEALPVFYIWREHRKVWEVWLRLQTQWVVSETGPTGLDYAGVDVVLRRSGVSRAEGDRLFSQIQHLEAGALQGYAKRREAARRNSKT